VVAKSAMDAAVIGMAPAQADELKIKVLPAYLETSPEISAKIDLAGAYISSGKADEAQAALFDAADSNSVHQDEEGKGNWTRINAAIAEAEKKKLIGSEQVAKLKQTYADWQTSYAEAQAEQKRIAEDEKKRDEELKKAGQEPVEGGKPDGKTPDGASSGDPKPDDKSGAGKP
jgi:hypothetical protein